MAVLTSRAVAAADPGTIAPLAVSVRDLTKRYRDGTAANCDLSLDVRRGDVLSVVGPNGAGKTTFLRQLTTELQPSAGSIHVFGIDVIKAPHRAKRLMGITPQDAGLFESVSVREHFECFARIKGLEKRAAQAAARTAIEELDLIAETDKRVGTLSGGQRRRVLIGLALLGSPPLLVLDEPTTGLDPGSRHAVWRVLRHAVARGATVVFSTHYMEEAERLSDRVCLIARGRVVAIGSLDELLAPLTRRYRVSCRRQPGDLDSDGCRYFATFGDAQRYVAAARLSEYSIGPATLEDVYFAMTGSRFTGEQTDTACAL